MKPLSKEYTPETWQIKRDYISHRPDPTEAKEEWERWLSTLRPIITFEGDGGEIFTEELTPGREIIFPSDALTVVKIELKESVGGGSEH